MSLSNDQLLDLKQKVEDAKTNVTRLKGQLEMLNSQLLSTWGCKTVESAQKKLIAMEKEASTLENQISEGKDALEENYGSFID